MCENCNVWEEVPQRDGTPTVTSQYVATTDFQQRLPNGKKVVVVIGGGFTGCSYTHFLIKQLEQLLLKKPTKLVAA